MWVPVLCTRQCLNWAHHLRRLTVFDLPNEGLGCLASKGNGIPLFLAAIGLVVGLTSTFMLLRPGNYYSIALLTDA